MSLLSRLLCVTAIAFCVVPAQAADEKAPASRREEPKVTGSDTVEFVAVTSIGTQTMINLYHKQEKRSFWVETGKTVSGITVLKYDPTKDAVTIRENGVEKILPLRAASGILNAPTPSGPAMGPSAPAAPAETPTVTPTPLSQLSKERQEEEARMLVSDLLEIGIAQRRAYEEAQRKAQGGQPAADANAATQQQGQPTAPAGQNTPAQQPATAETAQAQPAHPAPVH